MKKPELLAPAGNMESLKAAIAAGCDAVYVGGYFFGARSFAGNFSNEELKEAIIYAHLYHVKVYVTTNTLIYEKEIETFLNYVDYLYHIHVDALIIQDLGMMDLIHQLYPALELHASTQMHIHTEKGVQMAKQLGLKRAVVARETPIEEIAKMKKHSLELEVFVHGALCISYSGQCFMSSLIGGRSGNRGTCAQCCRQKYQLVEQEKNQMKEIANGYLLSTKDLNTLENIGALMELEVDSFKIEGRMKRPEYVYLVVSLYRKAIDSYYETKKVEIQKSEIKELKKLFNRTFTKGFLFHESQDHFTNSFRPNHLGIEIGKVVSSHKNQIQISLTDEVSIHDGIRILGNEDYGCTLNVFQKNGKIVKEAKKGDVITLEVKSYIPKGSIVLKTTDYKQLQEIQDKIEHQTRKVKIKGTCVMKKGQPIRLTLKEQSKEVTVESDITVEEAKTNVLDKERIMTQFQKLGNTCYEWEEFDLEMDENIFFPMKALNELRRKAVEKLNEERLKRVLFEKQTYHVTLKDYPKEEKRTFYARSVTSYQQKKNEKWDLIYAEEPLYSTFQDPRFQLKLPRIMKEYPNISQPVLIGELGSLFYQEFDTDFSFHVTNSYTLAFLHRMGARKVTLSYELTDEQIKELLEGYEKRYQKHPNVELIISGYLEAMVTKYNFYEHYHKKEKELYLMDRFHNLFPLENKQDYMIIYNSKKRNYKDARKYYEMGINSLRIEE